MKLPNKVYDILKWLVIVAMPALGVFYGVLVTTLSIPYGTETLTIWGALTTLIGTLIGVSSVSYKKGERL